MLPLESARNASPMTLRDLWRALRRSGRLIFTITAIVLGVTALVTFLLTPRYESEVVLRISTEDAKSDLLGKLESVADLGLPSFGKNEIETEIGVLRSRRIAGAVIDSLSLQVEMRAPRKPRESVLQVVGIASDARPAKYVLRHEGSGVYRVTVDDAPVPVRVPERVELGRTASLGGVSIRLLPALRESPPAKIDLRVRPYRKTLKSFGKTLEVEKDESGSELVSVTYRSPDPILAARVVNSVASEYIRYRLRTSNSEARSTAAVLRRKVAEYGRELHQSEARLQAFQERAGIVNVKAQTEGAVDRLGEILQKRDEMQVESASLARLLEQAEADPHVPGTESPYRRLMAFPTFIANDAVQSVLQDLTRLEDQRAQLLVRRTSTNADVQALDARRAELEHQLHQLATNYLHSLRMEIGATDTALAHFDRDLSAFPAKETEFGRLTRETELLGEVYATLQTHLKEAEVKAAIDPGLVRIVDGGMVAVEPVVPKPATNLVLGGILGLMLGLAAAVGREITDTTVRTPLEMELLTGGIPVLGAIPSVRRLNAQGRRNGRGPARLRGGTVSPAERVVTRLDPYAPAADAYRVLRDNLVLTDGVLSDDDAPDGIVVVTSAQAGDGASTVAANLAVISAQRGAPTLLVDANLRDGILHSLFDQPRSPGLADYLTGAVTLDALIREVDAAPHGGSLFLLPAGQLPAHTAELRSVGRIRELLAELRRRYDSVVIDAPPLDRDADALLLGSLATETLLVARSGVTDRDLVLEAVNRLRRANVHIGGLVLNDLQSRTPRTAPAGTDVATRNGKGH